MTIRLTLLAGLVLLALPLGAQTPATPGQALTLSKDIGRLPQPVPPSTAAAARPTAPDPNAIRVLLSPGLETTLVAQMVGRIATLNAALGSFVAKGKPIVTFDCSEAQARMQMAQAEHTAAKETLAVKINLRKLEAAGDLEVSMAESAANRTTAAIALAQAQLGQCSVTAPFSGHIVKTYVKPYQGINIGSPLVDMISDGPLKLRLNVPSKLLRTLKVGTPFEVDIEETGKTYTAKVTAINARVDAVAQTIELEARIDGKPANLLAGMTGFARLPMPR